MRGRCMVLMGLLLTLSGCATAMVTPSLEQSVEKHVAVAAAAPAGATPATAFQWEINHTAIGLDIKALAEHEALCKETGADACLVVHKGKIVQEYRSERYYEPFWAMSATKSVTALLVGMLIDAGKIKSVDEPACTYLRDWCDGDRGQVTLRHLLTMTAGLDRKYAEGVPSVRDKDTFSRKEPLVQAPGGNWVYSNEGVQLLSPILDKAAGESLAAYATKALFKPLGMERTRLSVDGAGNTVTYADMVTTPRDFARIGLMMLGKGSWQGKPIVSSHWIEEATRSVPSLKPGDGMRYGYLWWLSPDGRTYMARGEWENSLFVVPGKELVVVRMQNHEQVSYDGYLPRAFDLFANFVPVTAAATRS